MKAVWAGLVRYYCLTPSQPIWSREGGVGWVPSLSVTVCLASLTLAGFRSVLIAARPGPRAVATTVVVAEAIFVVQVTAVVGKVNGVLLAELRVE